MKNIVALLLAAGESSRFWPLPDKHSLMIFDKPLAYYSISQLVKFGVTKLVIVVNAQNEAIFSQLISIFPKVTINLVKQTDKRGMAGAIVSAKELIWDKSLLIINPADIYEDIIFSSLNKLLSSSTDGIIAGTTVTNYFPGGYLLVKGGKVNSIVEKPNPKNIPSDIITFVFDYFKNANILLSAIEEVKTRSDDVFEKALDRLIKKGQVLKFLHYRGFWGYLKYPWHTLSIVSYYLNKLSEKKVQKAYIASSALISGNVYIDDGVQILENTKIIGPTYIGRGTIIGNNCLIRESMIGANCVIGFASEVARSYIGDNCWLHSNYIGDSVLAHNVSMGAGSVVANFRLDEESVKSKVNSIIIDTGKTKLGAIIGTNVRIGINTSIMPGVKIGKNSFIGAQVLLDKDLADNQFCTVKNNNYTVSTNKAQLTSRLRQDVKKNLKF